MQPSPSTLTCEQIAQYREHGYILVEGVLETETLADLRRVTDAIVASAAGIEDHTKILDLEASHTPDEPRVRRIKQPHLADPFYRELAAHAGIMAALEPLIGKNIRLRAGGKINMKSADYGAPVEWHQDWAFYPHTNDDLLAVGVAIDDMTLENGCLLVVPGSHKGRIHDHHLNGRFAGAVTELDFTGKGAVPIELKAGGISIHHVRTLHASAPNTSGKPRRLLLFMYCAVDAFPLVQPINTWEEFNGKILRGEPTREPRMVSVPVRVPLPPAERTGSIYEIQTILEESKMTPVEAGAGN